MEIGIKIAIQYWFNKEEERDTIISLKNAYHGDTFGSMSVNEKSVFNQPFQKYLFHIEQIEVPDETNHRTIFAKLKKLIQSKNIAAFIFEPCVQGAAGMLMYDENYLDEMIQICQENRILTIADEVMTGFFRTGTFFVSSILKNKPDILCLSKGITGGFLPLGVTTATNEIYQQFHSENAQKTFFHGHSYTANPIAYAAAIASLKLLKKKETLKKIQRIVKSHSQFLNKIKNDNNYMSVIEDIRSKGTILAIEIKTEKDTFYLNSEGWTELEKRGKNRGFSPNNLTLLSTGVVYLVYNVVYLHFYVHFELKI